MFIDVVCEVIIMDEVSKTSSKRNFCIYSKGIFPPSDLKLYKCGYCGWLIKTTCEDLLEHECLQAMYNDATHDLVCDDKKVLTVVVKNTATKVAKEDLRIGSSWEEGFIKHVQDRPPLYNLNLPLTERTNAKKAQLWSEIANIYGGKISNEDLQKKWKYLRDCYIRAKKKVLQYKPSGSEGQPAPDPGFRHYELMKFLDDPATQNFRICSVDSSPSTSGVSSPMTSPSMTNTSTSSKKKKNDEKKDLEKGILEALNTTASCDGVDGFLMRLGESLRRLEYRERAQIEMKIMQFVYEAEFKPSSK